MYLKEIKRNGGPEIASSVSGQVPIGAPVNMAMNFRAAHKAQNFLPTSELLSPHENCAPWSQP